MNQLDPDTDFAPVADPAAESVARAFLDCIPATMRLLGELTEEPFPRYPYLTELLHRLATEWDGRTIFPGFKIEL